MKMMRGMELKDLGPLSLERRRLQGDLIAAFPYQKGTYKEAGEELFTKAHNDRKRGSDLKLKEGG